ncbi:MAG: phosphate-starvation-inducible PsiE family protein [Wenzhouxiangellaceae bacterium]|nr:phosphate-starvation-inducible PsiE family protein [Wenzhouxiangellaceae bacterium]
MTDEMVQGGRRAASWIQNAGLWLVLLATVVATFQEIWSMIQRAEVTLTDLLLLFIYLEVISMVNVYWQSGKLPVRMPLYIAMVALARYVILEATHLSAWQLLASCAGILVLAVSVIVVRWGHLKLPYPGHEGGSKRPENAPEAGEGAIPAGKDA